jgi:hypothetical protein
LYKKLGAKYYSSACWKTARTEKPKQNFSTLLTAKLALVMNTKNVEEQIIFLLSKV